MNLPTNLCNNCGEPSSRALCRRCTCEIDGCDQAATRRVSMEGQLRPLCETHLEQFLERVSRLRKAPA